MKPNKIKVYIIFYLAGDDDTVGTIYAHTVSKALKKKFMKQRRNDRFTVAIKHMTHDEYSDFEKKHRSQRLSETPLSTSPFSEIMIVATNNEEGAIAVQVESIEKTMNDAFWDLDNCPEIKNKYKKSIAYLIRGMTTTDSDGTEISTINTLKIFDELFGKTVLK